MQPIYWEDEDAHATLRTVRYYQRHGVVPCTCPACGVRHQLSGGDWQRANVGQMTVRDEGEFNEPLRWAVTCHRHTLFDVWLRVKGPTEVWRQRHVQLRR